MSEEGAIQAAIDANFAVIKALQPLAPDERLRVIEAVRALFGIVVPGLVSPRDTSPTMQDQPLSANPQVGSSSSKPMSLVEFLDEKNPATNSQRIACFAYYREKIEGKSDRFSSGDLMSYFALAKLAAPGKNYARDYKLAVSSAWIHDDKADSYLTRSGEDAVESGFAGKGKPRGATAGKKRKSAKAVRTE